MSKCTRPVLGLIATLALSMTLSMGCSETNISQSAGGPQNRENVFSDRPIGLSTEILMVQLSTPALLETSMSNQDIQTLLAEQESFEYKLARLSNEIRILYRYRYSLNGFALITPARLIPEIQKLLEVKSIEAATPFQKPMAEFKSLPLGSAENQITSVSFIGAQAFHEQGITGKGISVGVIDTGIDYTHKMLGGSGDPEDYKAIDPNLPTPHFPNEKVVGGIDLVGSRFSGRTNIYEDKIPQPDSNPIDEAGHGTHVAGTVAGVGDGENTYDGVAPDAKLHAIKVFGKDGGTFDAIVIAGFEYALDPNGDFDIDDRLDVLNLSLGGGFGTKKILYSKAIDNLTRSGMIVVAAAGNSGNVPSIVGAPATAEDAISVAASIDGRDLNWKFATVKFDLPNGEAVVSEYAEGPITVPLKDIDALKGKLVDIGLADQELSEQKKQQLSGNIALIQRGVVTFIDKLRRAEAAGAVGAIVYNNEDGAPIPMGSEAESDKVSIPGVMVSKAVGEQVAKSLNVGDVIVDFKHTEVIEKPELIDSITDFSSRGPRTDDYGFKPEISAPGEKILSAEVGKGTGGALSNGTSMASPHVAGAAALLRQYRPGLNSKEIKGLMVTTAKKLKNPQTNAPYLFTAQGAGRVQLDVIADADFFATRSLSLGLIDVPTTQEIVKTVTVKNLSARIQRIESSFEGNGPKAKLPGQFNLGPGETKEIEVQFQIPTGQARGQIQTQELNGVVTLKSQSTQIEIPVMAFRRQTSHILPADFLVSDEFVGKSQDKRASLTLKNDGEFKGTALIFNLIDVDQKKSPAQGQEWRSDSCDLQSVGYRWISKVTNRGSLPHLQFAFQLYEARNQLKHCDFSILIDHDKDGEPDQEIVGVSDQTIHGFQGQEFFAAVLDYKKAQSIRKDYEIASLLGEQVQLDYRPAVVGVGELHFATDSGLSVFEVPISSLKVNEASEFQAKIVSINNLGEAVESDDYLAGDETSWRTLTTDRFKMGFWGMEDVTLEPGAEKELSFMKSQGKSELVIYSPTNKKEMEMQALN